MTLHITGGTYMNNNSRLVWTPLFVPVRIRLVLGCTFIEISESDSENKSSFSLSNSGTDVGFGYFLFGHVHSSFIPPLPLCHTCSYTAREQHGRIHPSGWTTRIHGTPPRCSRTASHCSNWGRRTWDTTATAHPRREPRPSRCLRVTQRETHWWGRHTQNNCIDYSVQEFVVYV